MEVFITLALLGLALFLYFKFFKIPKFKNICFIDGTLGAGKSYMTVAMAIRFYKRERRRWVVAVHVGRLAKRLHLKRLSVLADREEPMLYSNIPLDKVKHCVLTEEMLLRKVRFTYKSVLLIDDISTIADQFDFKDREISDSLREFFKFFRHETKGGHMFMNSQTTSDLHYAIKAVLSEYFYIHHRVRLPFVSLLKVREMVYSADKDAQGVTNVENRDIESSCKNMIVSNKYLRAYDTYCFSSMTDGLPISADWIVLSRKEDGLKVKKVLTLRRRRNKE